MRLCPNPAHVGENPPLCGFRRDKSTRCGLASYCNRCVVSRISHLKSIGKCTHHPNKDAALNKTMCQECLDSMAVSNLKRYGLTAENLATMLIGQSGRCAACNEPLKTLHIDHDHKTNSVRGLLCSGCNIALGHLKENLRRILALAAYVLGWSK